MDYKFINTDYIESVAGGDHETIRELVSLFRDQVTEFSHEMQSLLDRKEYYQLGLLAHKAKSSISIMGMSDLAALLKAFELDTREGKEPEKYPSYISRFESDTSAAVKELEDFAAKL